MDKEKLLKWLRDQECMALNEDISWAFWLTIREINAGKFDKESEQ